MSETIVLGIGNLVHRDDGAGVRAIQALERDMRVPPTARLLDGGTLGLALLPHISGARRLLVIDAIDAEEPAGTVLRFEGDALRGLAGRPSVHQLGFADLMIALNLLDEAPAEIVLLGVQPLVTDWGTELTEPVESALASLVDCAVAQLKAWESCAS